MIITLTKANFSANNIGKISCFNILTHLGMGCIYNGPAYVEANTALSATINIQNGYELDGEAVVMMGSDVVTSGVTLTANNVLMVEIPAVTKPVKIYVPTKSVVGGDVTVPTTTITWEMGAIGSQDGTKSTSLANARVRTREYLRIYNTVTISCSGKAEFCPIYYDDYGVFLGSPNGYQTEPLTISGNDYPRVRLMIRDKTNTSVATVDLGNYITVTGQFEEKPFIIASNIPKVAHNPSWTVGAIVSDNGSISTTMKTRIYSTRTPLKDANLTITPIGDAEICPVWYNEDGTMRSTPAKYQTTPVVTNKADGHTIAVMARNKNNVNATLTANFGTNVTFQQA